MGNFAWAAGGSPIDVGSYTLSPSPYGLFDQGGNVYEFTEGLAGVSGILGTARGGYATQNSGAALASAASYDHDKSYEDYWIGGFRIVAQPGLVPEPATLSLLALGGIALLRKRRSV